ncbi:MAG: V-type ATP synthase subunit F [Candidatus Micrarchaeota archaeon]|nr:V-type ATP synthase subunit F [Candidatus Micrarchaeota archaeon]
MAGERKAGENKEKIAVISDSATATGFRLAGVEHTFQLSGQEAENKLSELLSDEKYGIIIVDERLVEWKAATGASRSASKRLQSRL